MSIGRVVRNISAGYVGAAVNGATLLILTPLVIRSLGTLEYGLWVTATALGSYFGSLNAGSGAAGVRSVASGAAREGFDQASRELGSIFRVYCVLGILACVGLIGLGFITLDRFGVPPELKVSMRWLIALIGINFLISFPFGLTRSALAGMQYFGLLNTVEVATALFRLAATAALLAAGMGVVSLGVVQLIASVAGHLARWRAIRRLAPEIHLTGGPTYRKLVPQAFLFSALSFGYESLRTLFENSDLLILGLLAGPQAVALFAVAATVASFVSKGLQPVSNVLFPLASRADSQGTAQARLLEVATRVNLALALPVVTLLMVDGGALLRLWAGESFASSLPILRALALAALVTAASLAPTTLLFGAGRVGVLLGAESWRYALNLALVVVGYRLYDLPGAAVGTLAATLGIDAWLVLRRCCPWGGVDPKSFLIHSVGAPLLTGLPVVLLMAAWKSWAPDPSLPLLLARAAACLGAFALMYGVSGTFREERRLVVRAWAEVFR
ncbi:MAG TPA: lipopolysaccharide biosynthesis protein [Candidatus Polarisedimenticolia bacterium]|nr:lipopolysaccharide biosynthesis protein [Candidatus Polarisedimenticolia bacterium]